MSIDYETFTMTLTIYRDGCHFSQEGIEHVAPLSTTPGYAKSLWLTSFLEDLRSCSGKEEKKSCAVWQLTFVDNIS